MGSLRRDLWSWGFLAPPLALALAFFITPLAYLFYVSLHAPSASELYGTSWTLANYVKVLSDPFYLTILQRTLGTAATILGFGLLVGYPVAYLLAQMTPRRRMAMMMLLMFPLMVSNVVRAYGWTAILGRRGVINDTLVSLGWVEAPLSLLYTQQAVVIGLLTILLPYLVISITNTLVGIDGRYQEAAQALGAGPFRTFVHVTLPLSSPGVASGLLLVFLLTLSAYVTITLIGGPRQKLLVSLIYDNVSNFQWPQAAATSFLLLAVAVAGTSLILGIVRPGRVRGG